MKQKESYREWLGDSYDAFVANLSHCKSNGINSMSTPDCVADFSDQGKIKAASKLCGALSDGEYVFYDRISSYESNYNPQPYHPQHGLLVEYMAHKFGAEPSIIHHLVSSLDREMNANIS